MAYSDNANSDRRRRECTSHAAAPAEDARERGALNADTKSSPAPTRRKRGRPAKLDEAGRAKICAFVQAGLSIRQAAAQVGCDHSAVCHLAKRNDEFARKLEMAQRKGAVQPLLAVLRASKRSWRAAAWLLQNHHPHSLLRREESEERDREIIEWTKRMEKELGSP